MERIPTVTVLLAGAVPATVLFLVCRRVVADFWDGREGRRLRSAPLPVRVAALLAFALLTAYGGSKGGGQRGTGSGGGAERATEEWEGWTLADVLEELAEGRKPWRDPALSGAALGEMLTAAKKSSGGGAPAPSAVPPLVPGWYKYDPTDTDGDGIPDLWEIWTRGDPLTPDSWLDRDGDGLSDLYEFWYQTDPRTADTDGDGFSDYFELDNGIDPLVRADFAPEEPDVDENGIIDLWEGSGYLYGFQDSDSDGFDDAYAAQFLTAATVSNYDVEVTVYSSRSALLAWGEGEGEGIVLPSCTNLTVRLRLDATQDTHLRLLPAPPGEAAEGLWKARMLVDWGARRPQETELARIRVGDGTIMEYDEVEDAAFIGILGQPPPSPPSGAGGIQVMAAGGDSGGFLSRWFRRPSITLSGTEGPRCRLHGSGLTVTAEVHRVEAPLRWMANGGGGGVEAGLVFSPSAYGYDTSDITVTASQIAPYHRVVVSGTKRFVAGQCQPTTTNILGAAWGSSHDPTNASDHLPRTEQGVLSHYTPNCPATTNTVHHLGFAHAAPVNTRNLVRIETGDPQDDDTDHCLGVVWSQGGSTNLFALLDENHLPFKDDLFFTVNGVTNTSGALEFSKKEPGDLDPTVYHIEMRHPSTEDSLDRLWVVVASSETKRSFDNWYALYSTNLTWISLLPKPYAKLVYSTNSNGRVTAVDPEPSDPGNWGRPSSTAGNFLHHNAMFEMRSKTVAGGHGNQACYGADGKLITSGIAGGTADYGAGKIWHARTHVPEDVYPFLRAVWLDGNPGKRTTMNNITRPCLYESDYIFKYIQCRPITNP